MADQVEKLQVYLMGDQPTTCPKCGARVNEEPIEQEDGSYVARAECLDFACQFTFIVEEDNDTNQ